MRTSTSSLFTVLVCLAGLAASSASTLAAQSLEEECAEVVADLNRDITEAWDSPEELSEVLSNWTQVLRITVKFYDPEQLAALTAEEVEADKEALIALRDCLLPRIEAAFNRLKRRMEELGALPGTVGSDARRERERLADLREAERVHAEVAEAVARILGGGR